MSKKYFDTKTGSLEEKITKIATEQPSITKPESNVKLTVEKSYFGVKPGSISDVAAKIVSEGLDPVNKDAVKKKFDNRKDKDIDNDGDVDSTDKYLHTRRSAISKNIKEMEYTSGGGMYALSAIKAKRQRIEKQLADLDRTDPKYAEKAKDLKEKIEKQKEIMQRKQKEVFDSYNPKLEAVMPDDKGEKINQMKHQKAKEGEKEIVKLKEDDMAKFHQMQKDGKSAEQIAKALGLDLNSVKKLMDLDEVRNPYAVGMAQAMKAKNDEPPLKKSTITKAHDIAKSIMKKEEIKEARWAIEGRVSYRGIGSEDSFYMLIYAPSKDAAERKAFNELDKARQRRKIGPGGGGSIDDADIESIEKTTDRIQAPTTGAMMNSYDPTQKEEVHPHVKKMVKDGESDENIKKMHPKTTDKDLEKLKETHMSTAKAQNQKQKEVGGEKEPIKTPKNEWKTCAMMAAELRENNKADKGKKEQEAGEDTRDSKQKTMTGQTATS